MTDASRRQRSAVRILMCFLLLTSSAANSADAPKPFPSREKLEYRIEWRMITAGTARIEIAPAGNNWETKMDLGSAGMVSKLYQVKDLYQAVTDSKFCGLTATLDAQEGKRHRATTLNFDNAKHRLSYQERDLIKNQVKAQETSIAPCTHEIVGALSALRLARIEVGKSTTLPLTSGKKTVMARIESQAKEPVKLDTKTYQTIRYEAFLFDNVLYQRKGRVWIWVTDDPARLPVQIQIRLGFPMGTISMSLDKEEQF